MMITALLEILTIGLLWPSAAPTADGDVLFATLYDGQNLATRIKCQMEEEQHFRYSSESSLWGTMGGKIFIEADILFHCLGADLDGKYGSEALKYDVQISNLKISEQTQREESILGRVKRGATRDFFSNSWKKVKNFFNKMLGRNPTETKRASSSGEEDTTVVISDAAGGDATEEEPDEVSSTDVYAVPFQLVQLANGSIPEIRFSENEVEDGRVKNFKRHLADAFATRLLHSHQGEREVERSVMGEHTSTYNISISGEKSNYGVAGLVSTSQPPESDGGTVIVVNKVVTTDDIVSFAPSDALNDKERMDIRSHQMQMFSDGRMTISRGISSLHLITSHGVKKRKKRATEDDATSYIHAETAFTLQLRRRRRRSVKDSIRLQQKKHSFNAASRIAEIEDVRGKRRLSEFQESVDLNFILDDFVSGKEIDYSEDQIQSLNQLIKQEMSLKLDEEANSLSSAIRRTFTLQMMKDTCFKNFSSCKDYLQLVALAGGPTAEGIFLHFVGNTSGISPETRRVVADILSDISRPSSQLLEKLIEMVEGEDTVGPLSISLGHLASSAAPDLKGRVSDLFSKRLLERKCEDDPLIIDLLEAVGNLKCDRITPRILEVSRRCRKSGAVQIASIHALRHSSFTDEEVQGWLESLLREGDCDVVEEVIASLMDKIQDQEMTPDVTEWPRFHFNRVDEFLRHSLQGRGACSPEDVLLYFGRKKNPEANEITYFERPPGRQKRRALWDNLNCREWTEDEEDRFNPIQGKEEFASDRATYNKRKSCLAFRKLGVKGANAEIYAGMFAGLKEPSDPPKYKLFTKFVSGFNFLGQQIEVGSFYFYLYSGKTKAYVRIMGRTRQEFTNDGCTPTELRYRPLKHIPLYLVSIANVQLSLGIHLSSRLSVDTLCPRSNVYQLQPLTDVRIGGEALGTVGLIRGAANLGANFNYKLQFTFTPTPNMCLTGSHGFDPMNINFESYFQLWNSVKQDWGKTRVWKPSFVSWELKKGELKEWFDDTCIAFQRETPPHPDSGFLERELE